MAHNPERRPHAEALSAEAALGVRFHDRDLLRQSLTHPSYVNERPDVAPASNQRLEFLGDALLDMVVARRLYADHPAMTEGQLTEARAAVVRDASLAEAAAALGIGEHLLLGIGEDQSGGRTKPSNLADALEAVAGALYLDQGYAAAEAFLLRALGAHLGWAGARPPQDAKSALQVAAQSRGLGAPTYELLAVTGPGHAQTFTVAVTVGGETLAEGAGPRKAEAERQAAVSALLLIAPPTPGDDAAPVDATASAVPAYANDDSDSRGKSPLIDASGSAHPATPSSPVSSGRRGARPAPPRPDSGPRWWILRPAALALGCALALLDLCAAAAGAVRFFLATGASPAYILQRKRWYETTILGRPMGVRGLLAFGRWAAEQGRARHWP